MSRRALLTATLLVLLGVWLYDPDTLTQAAARSEQASVDRVIPSRLTVVGGDTVNLAGQPIRLVGFDTPETYHAECASERRLGDEATDRMRGLLAGASSPQLAYLPRRDRYGRHLARLILDGRDVSDMMVGEGLARCYSGAQRQSWC